MSRIMVSTNPDGYTYTVECESFLKTDMTLDEVMAYISSEQIKTRIKKSEKTLSELFWED